jgi:hypothetical protein
VLRRPRRWRTQREPPARCANRMWAARRPSFARPRARRNAHSRIDHPDKECNNDQLEHALTALEVACHLRNRGERKPTCAKGRDQLGDENHAGSDPPHPVAPAAPRAQPLESSAKRFRASRGRRLPTCLGPSRSRWLATCSTGPGEFMHERSFLLQTTWANAAATGSRRRVMRWRRACTGYIPGSPTTRWCPGTHRGTRAGVVSAQA